ncbi:DNA repair protein RadC [Proteiniclasticum sp.]|uniref:RadC family protein n=1 Tax=Proteiniclasticum sp. TaxID=2053595 RepID=UPI0028A07411|nr:DNA repair protein RadC [Proteiniclasticum sp.]
MENKIMDMPQNERPQERLLRYGADSLSNSELLAVILRTGTKNENILNLSQRIITAFNGINGLLEASQEDLMKISGIKEAKASQILSMAEMAKRFQTYRSGDRYKINSPGDAADLIMVELREFKQEILKVLLLNTKNVVIGIYNASVGSLNSSIVHPREIYKEAIRKSAASIIMVHNHPSGDPSPSSEDIAATGRIKEVGKIIGIELLDHVIIGDGKYISLREKNLL